MRAQEKNVSLACVVRSGTKEVLETIAVIFETTPDGGLRVYSDDVPGFMLSHHDAEQTYKDVKPALETIISAMMKTNVKVVPV